MATLLLDMDDTILDMRKAWIDLYNERFGTSHSVDEMSDWKVADKFGQKILDLLDEEGFFASLVPYPNAVEVIERLSKKHDVIIVTASVVGYSMKEKGEWVAKHLPFLKPDNFCIFKRKDMVRGDLLFDDAPHNVEDFPGITVCPKNNYTVKCNPDYFVADMLEFESLVERLFGEEVATNV